MCTPICIRLFILIHVAGLLTTLLLVGDLLQQLALLIDLLLHFVDDETDDLYIWCVMI